MKGLDEPATPSHHFMIVAIRFNAAATIERLDVLICGQESLGIGHSACFQYVYLATFLFCPNVALVLFVFLSLLPHLTFDFD
jgi:hypothetical protein